MGAHDKVSNKIDDVAGKAKEAVGKATGDDEHRDRRQARPGEVQPQGRGREGEGRLQEVAATSQHRGRPPVDPTPVAFRVITGRSSARPMRRPPAGSLTPKINGANTTSRPSGSR